jgi:hypothetical protein
MAIIDMQTMRYINLLDKASHVKTHTCFVYNNTIMFAVPRSMVSKALGPDALNVRRIQEELGKRVRILPAPEGIKDLNEAALIGRNRRRLDELAGVIKDLFSLELKII